MQSQCTNCGAFTRRSLHHEEEYQSSVLLERLRTSNFPATDQETTHIRHDILPTVFADISSIDAKVAFLRGAIRSLEEERERLMNVQKKYTNLLTLQRTFPSEIWSEIFLCTLSSPSDFNAFKASGSLWRLSHVCQNWRNIALSIQSFWSTMDIRFPEAARCEADVQRLEVVLERSRQGLLDLTLSDGSDWDDGSSSDEEDGQAFLFDTSISKRLLGMIVAESHRWRKAKLSFSHANWSILYAPLRNRLPCLESVALDFDPLALKGQSLVSVFNNCPRLTKVTLSGGLQDVEFPWDQITELDLSHVVIDGAEERRACMRLIERCPLLEIVSTPFRDLEDDNRATYSNALKLNAAKVPIALTLPLLQEASLHANRANRADTAYYDSLHSLEQLLTRSNRMNSITSLSLIGVPLAASPDRTLHSLLSQTRCLTSLKLSIWVEDYNEKIDASDRDQIVTLLESLQVIPTKAVTFLPLLSSLDVRVSRHDESHFLPYFGPIGCFASVIQARWRGDDALGLARLRACYFSVWAQHFEDKVYRSIDGGNRVRDIFEEEETEIFDALVAGGMDLVIRVWELYCITRTNGVILAVPR